MTPNFGSLFLLVILHKLLIEILAILPIDFWPAGRACCGRNFTISWIHKMTIPIFGFLYGGKISQNMDSKLHKKFLKIS